MILTWYQQIPEYLDPIAFSIGSFSVRWYAICFLGAFLVAWMLVLYRLKKQEADYSKDFIERLFFWCFLGAVIGARIGFVVFYNPVYYWEHPLEIISPWSAELDRWTGISGLSYHGALVGILISGAMVLRTHKAHFLRLADFIAPAVSAGYVLGRIGNFLNGELYGRTTSDFWGMYVDSTLRYPSQLLEAFLEGFVPFLVLWFLRNRSMPPGLIFFSYLLLYSAGRFISEFFRQPDPNLGFVVGNLTMGQVLSIVMAVVAILLSLYQLRKYDILEKR